jgi:hypothetical protein
MNFIETQATFLRDYNIAQMAKRQLADFPLDSDAVRRDAYWRSYKPYAVSIAYGILTSPQAVHPYWA